MEPIKLLRQLAEKSIARLNDKTKKADVKNAWSGIGFSLRRLDMVAPMGDVTEIAHLPKYTPVPGTKPWMLGIANMRGRLLPIVDMETYFGGELSMNRQNTRVLVIETDAVYVGLLVSDVYGLKYFPEDAFNAGGIDGDAPFANYVSGKYQAGEQNWYRFEPLKLIDSGNFQNAAQEISAA
ncbi:purine-binding chemotaxis protein CheW [bacterium]|nr:purine-binding chemotaxis protein CheW [bacterium]